MMVNGAWKKKNEQTIIIVTHPFCSWDLGQFWHNSPGVKSGRNIMAKYHQLPTGQWVCQTHLGNAKVTGIGWLQPISRSVKSAILNPNKIIHVYVILFHNMSNHPDWIILDSPWAPTKWCCCTFDPAIRPGYPESSHHLQHGGSFAGARHTADVQHLAAAFGHRSYRTCNVKQLIYRAK